MSQSQLFESNNTLLRPGPIDPSMQIRALTWKQPFAELMLPPVNKIETRIWPTNYRGWVLICAGKEGYSKNQVMDIAGFHNPVRIEKAIGDRTQHFGKAIGLGFLSNCRPMVRTDESQTFVEYYSDLYCHIYSVVYPIVPIDWRGSQGWRTVPREVKEQIIIL